MCDIFQEDFYGKILSINAIVSCIALGGVIASIMVAVISPDWRYVIGAVLVVLAFAVLVCNFYLMARESVTRPSASLYPVVVGLTTFAVLSSFLGWHYWIYWVGAGLTLEAFQQTIWGFIAYRFAKGVRPRCDLPRAV
jgi:hypothetical protein